MTMESLIYDMVEAAEKYPGIDLIWYRTAVETASTIVSVFVGIALVALCVGMPLILAIELMFINFPPMTAALAEREATHEAAGVEKGRRNWGLFVNDARRALRMHGETGDNINKCYLKVKWKTMVMMSCSINLLFFGSERIVGLVTQVIGALLEVIARS